jgi:hypothetical protein
MVDFSFDVMAFSWPSIATRQKSHGKNLGSVGLMDEESGQSAGDQWPG